MGLGYQIADLKALKLVQIFSPPVSFLSTNLYTKHEGFVTKLSVKELC